MRKIKLHRLVARREVKALLTELTHLLPEPFMVLDASRKLVFGEMAEHAACHPVALEDQTLGEVCGGEQALIVAGLLRHLAVIEREKKAVVNEAMEKYFEINLLYGFAEDIASVRDPEEAGRLVIEKVQNLIRADNGSIMLHNAKEETMTVLAWFGNAPSFESRLKPFEGIQGRVLSTGVPIIANDAQNHPYFVRGDNAIASLICVPLSIKGRVIGVINVSCAESCRDFRAQDQKVLTALASQAAVAIDNALLYARLEQMVRERTLQLYEAMERINNDLARAGRYINRLLPPPITTGPVRTDWRFVPSASLGGDTFGYHWIDAEHFALYLLDVSGHGMDAALFSVSVLNTLRTQALSADFTQPATVLGSLNNAFPMESQNEMYFTIWYGVYHAPSRTLRYASGGHHAALLFAGEGATREPPGEIMTPNMFVGGVPDFEYVQDETVLETPCRLYVFSDGVFEIKGQDDAMWEYDAFVSMLQHPPKGEILLDRMLYQAQMRHGSERLPDDFTILEVRFKE